jgi:hypothetical protein
LLETGKHKTLPADSDGKFLSSYFTSPSSSTATSSTAASAYEVDDIDEQVFASFEIKEK